MAKRKQRREIIAGIEMTDENVDRIVEETATSVRPGSIVLLHVMDDSRSASRAAVPLIVGRLRADGYRFVTVSELLALGR